MKKKHARVSPYKRSSLTIRRKPFNVFGFINLVVLAVAVMAGVVAVSNSASLADIRSSASGGSDPDQACKQHGLNQDKCQKSGCYYNNRDGSCTGRSKDKDKDNLPIGVGAVKVQPTPLIALNTPTRSPNPLPTRAGGGLVGRGGAPIESVGSAGTIPDPVLSGEVTINGKKITFNFDPGVDVNEQEVERIVNEIDRIKRVTEAEKQRIARELAKANQELNDLVNEKVVGPALEQAKEKKQQIVQQAEQLQTTTEQLIFIADYGLHKTGEQVQKTIQEVKESTKQKVDQGKKAITEAVDTYNKEVQESRDRAYTPPEVVQVKETLQRANNVVRVINSVPAIIANRVVTGVTEAVTTTVDKTIDYIKKFVTIKPNIGIKIETNSNSGITGSGGKATSKNPTKAPAKPTPKKTK